MFELFPHFMYVLTEFVKKGDNNSIVQENTVCSLYEVQLKWFY